MNNDIIRNKINAGASVVDVRSPDEFASGHFPNARNIPANEIMQRISDFGPPAAPIVVYCEHGSRSEYVAMILRASGFTDVTDGGGIAAMLRLAARDQGSA